MKEAAPRLSLEAVMEFRKSIGRTLSEEEISRYPPEEVARFRAKRGVPAVPEKETATEEAAIKEQVRTLVLEGKAQKLLDVKAEMAARQELRRGASREILMALRVASKKGMFTGPDKRTGPRLAQLNELEPEEAAQGWRLLRRYKAELAKEGIEVEQIAAPARNPVAAAKVVIEPLELPEPREATKEEAWAVIGSWLRRHYWYRDQTSYDLCGLYIVSTYLQEEAVSAPFLIFHGETVSGKSQITAAVTLLCHRGLFVLNPSEAAIFRIVDDFRGLTLFIDEFTFDRSMTKNDLDTADMFKLLRGSFTKGAVVIRVEETEAGRKAVGYNAFGPKGFNTTRIDGLPDDLVNRSLVLLCLEPPEEERWREAIATVDTPEASGIRAAIRYVVEEAKAAGLPPTANLSAIRRADMRLADMGKTLSLAAAVMGKSDVLLRYLEGELKARQERAQESIGGKVVAVLSHLVKARMNSPLPALRQQVSMTAIHDAWPEVHEVEKWEDAKGRAHDSIPATKTIAAALRRIGFDLVRQHTMNLTSTFVTGLDQPNGTNLMLLKRLELKFGLGGA